MRCEKISPLLNAYVDGELQDNRKQVVERHLKTCDMCSNQLESFRLLDGLLDAVTVPPTPHGFSTRVMAEARKRLSDIAEDKPKWGWWPIQWQIEFPRPILIARLVAILIFCLLGTYFGASLSSSINSIISSSPISTRAMQTQTLYAESFDLLPPGSPGARYLAFLEEGRK